MECFIVQVSDVKERLDTYFHKPYFEKLNEKLNESKWEIKKFKELIDEFNGGPMGFHLHTYDYTEEGIPLLRIKNLKKDYLDKDDKFIFISEKKHNELKKSQIKEGDIIFSKAGKVGEISIVPKGFGEGNLNQALSVIRLKKEYSSLYVMRYLKSKIGQFQIRRYGGGRAVQDDLKMSEIANFKIILPTLEAQNKIVELMDKAYQNKKQKEQESKELLDSINNYVIDELGIEVPKTEDKKCFVVNHNDVKIGRLDPYNNLHPQDTFNSKIYKNKILHEIANLTKGKSITKNNITSGDYPVIAGGQRSPYSINQYNYDGNIITVSASGAYSGYVWYHDYPIFASDCSVIKSIDENICKTNFIFCVMKAKQKYIYNMQQGAGQPHVYARDLQKLKIPLPSIKIQEKIVNEVMNRTIKSKQLKKESLDGLNSAKNKVEEIILGS